MNEQDKITETVRLLNNAKSILFITGAGVSADSGLPTYRGIAGLYNDKDTKDSISVERALSGETFDNDPAVTWKYLKQIEQKCRGAAYNRAHEVIAEAEKRFDRVWVLTQNVDGFHEAAGSKNIIDIHGNLHRLHCTKCKWTEKVNDYSALEIPPRCPSCKGYIRPDVVLFGEMLPLSKVDTLYRELNNEFDVYFSVGTSSVFPYISQPILQAKSFGKPAIEINPSETELSEAVDIKISLGAAEALDKIWNELNH